MKRQLRILFISMLVAVLCLAVMPSAFAEELEITWNELNNETYGATVGARAFDEKLREISGGTMAIDLYTEGALGSEQVSLQSLQMGTLDIFRGNASSMGDYGCELLGATGLPFLFQNIEEFKQMADSPLGQRILDSVEEADCGFVAVSWMVEGPRNFFLTQSAWEALGSPAAFTLDLMKGLRIRVPGASLISDTVSALGADPIPVAYSEMVTSLNSGNIEGAENGMIPYATMGFCDAAPCLIDDAHTFGCGVVLMSADSWNSLTGQQQAWMREAGKAASEACYEHNVAQEEAYREQLLAKGVRIIPVEDIEQWQAACSAIYDAQSEPVQALIRQIRDHDYS